MKKTFRERHQAWERLVTARGHLGWSRRYVSPFMSAWCIHQQYCHVNQVSGTELLEPIDIRDAKWRTKSPRVSRSFLWTDAWLPPLTALGMSEGLAFSDFLKAIQAAALGNRVNGWLTRITDDNLLRLCPGCRQKGYQSMFDQVLGLERCPIHGEPYVTACFHCGAGLPSYRFERMRDPLVCTRCNAYLMPFSDRASIEISTTERERQQRAWGPFASWCALVARYVPRVAFFPYRTEETEPVPPAARFLWVLNEIEPLPKEMLPFVAPRTASLRTIRIPVNVEKSNDSLWNCRPLEGDAARDRKAVFNSVARHLRRRHLMGHRECLRLAAQNFGVLNVGESRWAPRYIGGCHVAQAYLFWRYSLCRNRSRPHYAPVIEMYVPSDDHSDIRIWGHRILCAFWERFAAMRLAYGMEAAGNRLFVCQEGVRDIADRLELARGQLHLGSVVVETSQDEVVVIGRASQPELILMSCASCRRRKT